MKASRILLLIPCVMLFACSRKEPPPTDIPEPVATTSQTPGVTVPAPTGSAMATLVSAADSPIRGDLKLTASETGVRIEGDVTGLPTGQHGFHIHENGACAPPDFKSAGEHLNPSKAEHGGGPTTPTHHLGDLPNIVADGSGHALIDTSMSGATLRDGGANDLIGRAFIIHAQPDDYVTQPSGNSGARLACAIVK